MGAAGKEPSREGSSWGGRTAGAGRISRRGLLCFGLAGGLSAVLSGCKRQLPGAGGGDVVAHGSAVVRIVPSPTAIPATPPPTPTPTPPMPLLVNPQFRRQDTPVAGNLGPDGYTW